MVISGNQRLIRNVNRVAIVRALRAADGLSSSDVCVVVFVFEHEHQNEAEGQNTNSIVDRAVVLITISCSLISLVFLLVTLFIFYHFK